MSKREVFLVGGRTDVLANTKLPTGRSVLKYYHYRLLMKHKQNSTVSSNYVSSCSLGDKFQASCTKVSGCLNEKYFCVLNQVKKIWLKAGIPFLIQNQAIRHLVIIFVMNIK